MFLWVAAGSLAACWAMAAGLVGSRHCLWGVTAAAAWGQCSCQLLDSLGHEVFSLAECGGSSRQEAWLSVVEAQGRRSKFRAEPRTQPRTQPSLMQQFAVSVVAEALKYLAKQSHLPDAVLTVS